MEAKGKDSKTKESFEPFDNPMQEYVEKHLSIYSKLVWVRPHNTLMQASYAGQHESIMAYPCRGTDVWVASYPKAGTTWTQEMVWSLMRGLGHEHGKKPLMERFPFFEWDALMNEEFRGMMSALSEGNVERPGGQWRVLEQAPDPRMVKTHMHRALLPSAVAGENCKVIYVMRDPRDVCVSLYYHCKKLINYDGDFDNFVKTFLYDVHQFGPFWSNILSYWETRHTNNTLFLRYEDLKQDLSGMIQKVAAYLDVSLAPGQLAALTDHLTFDTMKNNPAANNETIMADTSAGNTDIKFMRKGIVGDHKNHLSESQLVQFREWTDTCLKDSDFPYYRD